MFNYILVSFMRMKITYCTDKSLMILKNSTEYSSSTTYECSLASHTYFSHIDY